MKNNHDNDPLRAFLRVAGFSLFRGLPYIVALIPSSSRIGGQSLLPLSQSDWLYACDVLALSATLLACGFCTSAAGLAGGKKASLFAAALLGISTALVALSSVIPSEAIALIGHILQGLSSAILNLYWAAEFAKASYRSIVIETPLALCIAPIFGFVGPLLPPYGTIALAILMPFAIAATVVALQEADRKSTSFEPLSIEGTRVGRHIVVTLLVIAIIGGFMRSYVSGVTGASIIDHAPLVAGSAIGLAIIYAVFLRRDTIDFGIPVKASFILLALSVLLIPAFPEVGIVEATLLYMGFICFRMFTWLALLLIVKSNHLSSQTITGIGWGLVSLGELIGTLGFSAFNFASLGGAQQGLVVAVATTALIVAMLVPFDTESLTRMLEEPGSSKKSLSDSDQRHRSAPGESARPTFSDRCEQIAREYGLTPKETEIMTLMAKGYAGSHLCEKLVLSRNTISTHQQHIYRKMDIHSKRELLDIIDGNL